MWKMKKIKSVWQINGHLELELGEAPRERLDLSMTEVYFGERFVFALHGPEQALAKEIVNALNLHNILTASASLEQWDSVPVESARCSALGPDGQRCLYALSSGNRLPEHVHFAMNPEGLLVSWEDPQPQPEPVQAEVVPQCASCAKLRHFSITPNCSAYWTIPMAIAVGDQKCGHYEKKASA